MWNNNQKAEVSVRGGFSDRNGIKVENTLIQITDFDKRTRVAFSNALGSLCNSVYPDNYSDKTQSFIKSVMFDVYTLPVDSTSHYLLGHLIGQIQETIMNDSYDSVLTVLEYIVKRLEKDSSADGIIYSIFNGIFETEFVGYRFAGEIITPITSDEELAALKDVLNITEDNVSIHVRKALGSSQIVIIRIMRIP